jgi:hypothetical protein
MRRTGLGLFLLSALAAADVLPSLTLDDPDTDLLRRLEGRNGCELPSRRPWPGEAVLACLDSLLASQDLSLVDRARVESARRRLAPADSGWGLIEWTEGSKRARLDLGATLYATADRERTGAGFARADTIGRDVRAGLQVRPRVDVILGQDLSMWSRPVQSVEVSPNRRFDKESDAEQGVYQTALFAAPGELSKARTHDWLEGAVELRGTFGRASMGLLPVEWGDLPVMPLMLAGGTSPFPLVQVVQSVGPIEATLLYGQPIGDSWSEDRRLYAHRFAWATPNFTLGFSEMVIAVDRGVQPLYLIPVFPYLMAEHLLGDPDNKQMDFDAAWKVAPTFEVSAELFIDDLQNLLGFFSNAWGNKWGLGIGARLSDWTGAGTLDRLQATRMEPWAGTASSSILPGSHSNAPVDFGTPLGWMAGPNSGELDWIHRQDLSEAWSWSATVRALWKGTDSGSGISDRNWRDSSGTWVVAHPTKKWLGGNLVDRQGLTVLAERRFGHGLRVVSGAGITRLSVPDRPVRWIPSVQMGVSWNE